jgi:hypothetical protein
MAKSRAARSTKVHQPPKVVVPPPLCPICDVDDRVERAESSPNVHGVFWYCRRCDEGFSVSPDPEDE